MNSYRTQVREALGLAPAERVVATGSMWPLIAAGSSVRVRREKRTPRCGEVWVADATDRHVVHRVLWVRRDGSAFMKGDRSLRPDGWIPASALFGPVEAVRRPGSTKWRPLNRLPGRLLGLGLSATWFAYLHTRALAARLARRALRRV